MANTIGAETIVDTDFEREQAELLKRAEEKPTLRMINAKEARPIEEWKRLYQEQALFIEVTKEDFSKVYEGKLIATAESSIEFIDLDKEYDRYDAEMVRLRKIAEEKPTLRIVNSIEIKPIKEWEELYPELWLLIEVTREDVHQIYEGKLIATAENSI